MDNLPLPPPLPPAISARSGSQGIWQWFISVGCVSMLLLLLALMALVVGIVLIVVFAWKWRIDQWL